MNKIYIDNEEVICDSSYKIEEELKNPSSVILDKVYPKRWKGTNKLLTDFYFPKDYSKCLIKDVTNIPAEEGEYATGTNLNINVDNTKEWNYKLEGDTQQEETPTPSNPQNIEVVTGGQNVIVEGKNLYDKDNDTTLKKQASFSGAEDNEFTTSNTNVRTLIITKVPSNKEITLSINNDNYTRSRYFISQLKTPTIEVGKNERWYTGNSTIVTTDKTNYLGIVLEIKNNGTTVYSTQEAIDEMNIQIEEGSQATEYEPYQSQNYSINLGKNLFDKDNANIINGWFDTSTTKLTAHANARTLYIKCLPNTTYTITKLRSKQFDVGCTNVEPSIGMTIQKIETGTTGDYDGVATENYTYTTNSTAQYLLVRYAYSTQVNLNLMISSIQIEKGNVATPYASYITPIELCKIGNYQDYIYEQNGDWYIHKEIVKVILTENSYWSSRNVTISGTSRKVFFSRYDNLKSNNSMRNMMCNYFKVKNTYGSSPTANYQFYNNYERTNNLEFTYYDFTTLTEWKEWVASHNIILFGKRVSPTDTQITDATLIQQLNNLKNATLYNGVNNISVDGELPIILDLHYNYVTARTDEELIFAGIVKNSGNMVLDPRKPHYCSLQILDYSTFLSESDTLDFVINNKTIPEAIEQVVKSISSYGFILGNIDIKDTESIIGAYSTLDKAPYDVFDYFSKISNSIWFTRLINENTIAVDFYDIDYLPQNDNLEYTSDYFKKNKINDIEYDYSTNDYRNKQIIKSDQVYGNVDYNESIIADGYAKSFNTMNNIGILQSIYVDGIEKSYATQDEKNIGIEADFYYEAGKSTFESNENDDTYSAGSEIKITYTPLISGRQVLSNTDEISRINTQVGNVGVIARYENRNDILSANELNEVANSYLNIYSYPEIILKINSSLDFLNLGSKVFFDAPIEDLKMNYLVKKRTTKIIQSGDFELINYEYELSSSFNTDNELNYFDNQRAKASGNIQSGDYITRNIDVESTAKIIFKNATATEITINDNNVLNAPLNAPFTQ